MMRRLLALSLDHASIWVQLSVQPIGNRWAGMILADGVAPPRTGELTAATCGPTRHTR
jgi:hypothetical protein